jgi:hypothetical protein
MLAKGVSDLLRSGTASLREILSDGIPPTGLEACCVFGDFFAIDEDFVADSSTASCRRGLSR